MLLDQKSEIYSFEISFNITESMTLPTYKGFKIYGIMGDALRKVFCSNLDCKDCSQCSEKFDCRFADLFHGIKKEVSFLPDKYQKYSNLPSRFSINPPLNRNHSFQKDEIIKIQFNFLGNISSDFPLITTMLENMKEFKPDYKSEGRFRLQQIKNRANKKNVYEKGIFYPENLEKFPINYNDKINEKSCQIEFITPTRLTYNGKHIMDELTGEILTQRIRERAMLLFLLYSDIRDIPEVQKDAIEILEKKLFWKEYQHRSFRQNNINKYGGFIGRMRIKINDPTIISYLKLLEFMHLGSNAKTGFGTFKFISDK